MRAPRPQRRSADAEQKRETHDDKRSGLRPRWTSGGAALTKLGGPPVTRHGQLPTRAVTKRRQELSGAAPWPSFCMPAKRAYDEQGMKFASLAVGWRFQRCEPSRWRLLIATMSL